MHTRIYGETFHVNSSSNDRKHLKFYGWKLESTRNINFGWLSGRYQTLIWRPGELTALGLSLGKESPQIFSKFNPLNTVTPLTRTLSITPSVTILRGFGCISRRAVSVCLGCCILQSQCIYFLYIFYFYTFALLSHLRENSTINTLSVESKIFLVE